MICFLLLLFFFVFFFEWGRGGRLKGAEESIKQSMIFIFPNFLLIIINLIQSKFGKIGTRTTPNMDTFYAVCAYRPYGVFNLNQTGLFDI